MVEDGESRRTFMGDRAKNLKMILERGFMPMLKEERDKSPEFSDEKIVMLQSMTSGLKILDSITERRWPASIISDTDIPGERLMRTLGLSFLEVPELVMRFKVEESDAAMGIFNDLIHTAFDNPDEARGKIYPGRRVYAFRFGRKYYMHCALSDECPCNICNDDDELDTSDVEPSSSPLWNVVRLFELEFKAVQIVLAPAESGAPSVNPPDGPRCSACNKELPAQHKRCPCHAVAYCNKECQTKHWRVHKVMCAKHGSISQQLSTGELWCGVRIV